MRNLVSLEYGLVLFAAAIMITSLGVQLLTLPH
jgi:hypothetical protein